VNRDLAEDYSMKRKQLQDRIINKLKRESLLLVAGSLGAFVVGLVILFFTFWSTFGLLIFTTYWWISLSYNMLKILSAVFLALLFIGNATTKRAYLNKLELERAKFNCSVSRSASGSSDIPIL
jgi:hypothetical protein